MKQFPKTDSEAANQEPEKTCNSIKEIHQDWLKAIDAVPNRFSCMTGNSALPVLTMPMRKKQALVSGY